jgi:hypothetical protein
LGGFDFESTSCEAPSGKSTPIVEAGHVEERKNGRLEDWKIGRLEDWSGRMNSGALEG